MAFLEIRVPIAVALILIVLGLPAAGASSAFWSGHADTPGERSRHCARTGVMRSGCVPTADGHRRLPGNPPPQAEFPSRLAQLLGGCNHGFSNTRNSWYGSRSGSSRFRVKPASLQSRSTSFFGTLISSGGPSGSSPSWKSIRTSFAPLCIWE